MLIQIKYLTCFRFLVLNKPIMRNCLKDSYLKLYSYLQTNLTKYNYFGINMKEESIRQSNWIWGVKSWS